MRLPSTAQVISRPSRSLSSSRKAPSARPKGTLSPQGISASKLSSPDSRISPSPGASNSGAGANVSRNRRRNASAASPRPRSAVPRVRKGASTRIPSSLTSASRPWAAKTGRVSGWRRSRSATVRSSSSVITGTFLKSASRPFASLS